VASSELRATKSSASSPFKSRALVLTESQVGQGLLGHCRIPLACVMCMQHPPPSSPSSSLPLLRPSFLLPGCALLWLGTDHTATGHKAPRSSQPQRGDCSLCRQSQCSLPCSGFSLLAVPAFLPSSLLVRRGPLHPLPPSRLHFAQSLRNCKRCAIRQRGSKRMRCGLKEIGLPSFRLPTPLAS
jgi:hypothetical protein